MTNTFNAIGALIAIVFLLMMCSVPVPIIDAPVEVMLEVPELLVDIITPLDLQWLVDGKLVEGTPQVMLTFISGWMNQDPRLQTWYSESLNSVLFLSQMGIMKAFGDIWCGLVFEGDSLFSGGIAVRTYWDELIISGGYKPVEHGSMGLILGGG